MVLANCTVHCAQFPCAEVCTLSVVFEPCSPLALHTQNYLCEYFVSYVTEGQRRPRASGQTPKEASSPFPVATYCMSYVTTQLPQFFILKRENNNAKQYGPKKIIPVMSIWDGSTVLLQAISIAFCKTNLRP